MFRNKLYSILAATTLISVTATTILPQHALAADSKFPRPSTSPSTEPVEEPSQDVSDPAPTSINYTIDALQNGKIVQVVSDDIYYQKYIEEPVTRGITAYRFERLDAKGWQRGNVLVVDLKDSNVKADLLFPGSLSSRQSLSGMIKNTGAVAGVNGDFFDIGKTNAPLGVAINDNNILKSDQSRNQSRSVGITNDGLGFVAHILFQGTLKNVTRNAPVPLNGINEVTPQPGQIVLYNSLWGQASRAGLVGKGVPFTEIVVRNNAVAEILDNKTYSHPPDANTQILLGSGTAAAPLKAAFAAGEQVEITYNTNPDFKNIQFALSGDVPLVENGNPVSQPSNPYTHPRTAVGISQDKTKMYVATIDGRYAGSRGMTYDELGVFMASLGAWNAVNLDSGGSTEMISRPLAETTPVITNRPSDGAERPVPNGLGFWSTAPAGSLAGFKLEPMQNNKVLSGLTRSITAKAFDEYTNPLTGQFNPSWSSDHPEIGSFAANGVFKGLAAGKTTVTATSNGKTGSIEMQVLGSPVRITPSVRNMDLTSGQAASFVVRGTDNAGYEALIESRDITLEYDRSLLEITPAANGKYTIKPLGGNFATTVTISAGGLKTTMAVTAGTERKLVNTFDNGAQWSFVPTPAETTGSVSLTQAEGRGNVLKLQYDFTKTDAHRMADIKAEPGPIELPGRPIRVGILANGDNAHGEWLRMTLRDSANKVFYVDLAKTIDWKGWKYVSGAIPSEAVAPIRLDRIYVVEQNAAKKYAGSILVDDLTVEYQKTVNLPAEQPVEEPILSDWDNLPSDAPKFAVVSGMELKDSSSIFAEIWQKQLLDKLKLEGIDFVIFNGNIVTAGTPENYQFARDFLLDKLSVPYYVVPGKQDVSDNKLTHFVSTFGNDFQKIDKDGTRFILLNSTLGNLRVSNPSQWRNLLQWLKDGKADPSVKNIVVVNQASLNIASVLSGEGADSYEEDLLEQLLTEVKESGKNVAYISSAAKEAAIKRLNGVSYIDTGYSLTPACSIFGINEATDGNSSIVVKFTP